MKAIIFLIIASGVMLTACGRDYAQADSPIPLVEIDLSDFTNLPEAGWAVNVFPPSVNNGLVSFKVKNVNTASTQKDSPDIPHNLLLIKSDLPPDQLPRLGAGLGVDVDKVDVWGLVQALNSGEEGTLSVRLEQGSYVIVCNISARGTDFASHYQEGMYTKFTVRGE